MSYESANILPMGTSLSKVKNLIELMGYTRNIDGFSIPNRVGSYFWLASYPDISFVGVELNVYKENNVITVYTRSRIGRSYWDLSQQNKTIKYLHDYLGGSFETDEGKGRYLYRQAEESSRLAAGLYLSRWIFHNALLKPHIFLDNRNLQGDIAKEHPTGLDWLDGINPRFFSNSIILPYIIGAWEEYFRSSFVTLLRYTDCNPKAYKQFRVRPNDIEDVLKNGKQLDIQIVDSLSFQRPSVIDANFKLVNDKIDIAGCLRKPYKRRKLTLYDYIDRIVEERNLLVHTAASNITVTDKELSSMLVDFEAAADRVYDLLGNIFDFIPDKNF